MLDAVRLEGYSGRVTGGEIKNNVFDSLSGGNSHAVKIGSVSDDGRDYAAGENLLENNTFGPTWLGSNQTAIFVSNSDDSVRIYKSAISATQGYPEYGILNYSTRSWIYGNTSRPESESAISGAHYGLYCFSQSSSDPGFASVRQCSFTPSLPPAGIAVYVNILSTVDLGSSATGYGYNAFHGKEPTVNCDNRSNAIKAEKNYWEWEGDPTWPFIEDVDSVDYEPYLSYNPFGLVLKPVVVQDPQTKNELEPAMEPANYPNPFNASTIIRFALADPGRVEVAVYNILGQRIRTLATGDRPAGVHDIPWDGRDGSGRAVSSGIYFYRIFTSDSQITRRMVVVK